jgi:hypothetical protein
MVSRSEGGNMARSSGKVLAVKLREGRKVTHKK